ncbi:hypothetical protein [Cohnella cellulosilytica]|uniref:hypothetical protein n=1 Tax=Cohnella cellulosilytica TaxID=986710 RepID=UPI00361155C7
MIGMRIIVHRLFELKELLPHWPLSEFAKQLNYDGYKTAQGNRVLLSNWRFVSSSSPKKRSNRVTSTC